MHRSSARFVPALALAAMACVEPTVAAVEEIVVTARKVEENLQEVPLAVSAFTPESIEQLNLRTLDDIAKFTPGFSFTSAFGRQSGSDRPAIRGITTIQNGIGNASAVAYFVDGVYLGSSPQSTELFNLERVEVLKGPQAAQFGRGTYAGAINYVTRRPSMDEFDGGVALTGAEHETYEASGWVSTPIIDNTLALYVAAGYDTYDGEYTNQRTSDEVGGTETTSATAKLLWTPTENLDVTLKFGVQSTDDDHFAIYLQPRTENNCFLRTPQNARAREYFCGTANVDENGINLATDLLDATGISGAELRRYLSTLTVDYELESGATFTSVTGLVQDNLQTGYDVSYAGYDPLPFGASRSSFFQLDRDENEVFTQEFRVSSARNEPVRGMAGFYFLQQTDEEKANRKVNYAGGTSLNPQGPYGEALQTVSNLTDEEVRNFAFFGGVEWDATERATLGAELRYAEDEVHVSSVLNDGSGAPDSSCDPNRTDGIATSCSKTFDSLTPRLTARYRLTDEVNLYANVAKGTKPGDFNANLPTDPVTGLPDTSFEVVDEETMWSYEVGAKTEWFDRRLVANLAVYFNDVRDQQLTQNIEGPGGVPQSVLVNAGKTEVWGTELELNASITDNWTGGFVFAWTDSEIEERLSGDQADLVGNTAGFVDIEQFIRDYGDVSGQESPRVPEIQYALFTRYEMPMSWGSWYAGADFTFEESKYAQEHNLIETGDRSLLGARIGFRAGPWDFSIWGKNITDEDAPLDIIRYIDRRSGTLTSCNATLGAPATPTLPECQGSSTTPRGFGLTLQPGRQVGATLTYKFGGE
jgi:outer membrane receptor protein involved in Fe transport